MRNESAAGEAFWKDRGWSAFGVFRQTYRLPLADTFYSFIVFVAVCVHCADAVSCWPLVIAVSGFNFFPMGFVFLLSSFPIYM